MIHPFLTLSSNSVLFKEGKEHTDVRWCKLLILEAEHFQKKSANRFVLQQHHFQMNISLTLTHSMSVLHTDWNYSNMENWSTLKHPQTWHKVCIVLYRPARRCTSPEDSPPGPCSAWLCWAAAPWGTPRSAVACLWSYGPHTPPATHTQQIWYTHTQTHTHTRLHVAHTRDAKGDVSVTEFKALTEKSGSVGLTE